MAVKLRLKRMGRRKRPFYRIVAIDSMKKRSGREIERLGWFNPISPKHDCSIKEALVLTWLKAGGTIKNFITMEPQIVSTITLNMHSKDKIKLIDLIKHISTKTNSYFPKINYEPTINTFLIKNTNNQSILETSKVLDMVNSLIKP